MSDQTKNYSKKWVLTRLTTLALLIALEVVLSRILSFQQWNMRFSFGFIPVVVAGIMFGPIAGGTVATLGDIIGANLFPMGPFFPGYTLTALLVGLTYGILLHKKVNMGRIIIACLLHQIVYSWLINSYWISMNSKGATYIGQLTVRSLQMVIMSVVSIIVIRVISKELLPRLKMAMAR